MPITQNRMLDLVIAAQDYKQALERLLDILDQQSHLVTANRRTPEQAWQIASLSSNALSLMNDPLKSNAIIIAELVHFKNNAKRNERKARKARAKREEQRYGLPVSKYPTTAPRQIGKRLPGSFVEPKNPEALSQLEQATIKQQTKYAEQPEPEIKMLSTSTDEQQVSADSDLFGAEPEQAEQASTLSPALKARLDREVAERIAAEDYADQYSSGKITNKPSDA